jgi:hypothetical protein
VGYEVYRLINSYLTLRRAEDKNAKNNFVPEDEGITIHRSVGNLSSVSKRHILPENMNLHLSILQGAVSESLR